MNDPGIGEAAMADVLQAGAGARLRREGVERGVRAGMPLRPGDELASGDGAPLLLRYRGEPTELSLEPRTRRVLLVGPSGKRIEFLQGEISARVAAQPGGRPLVIEAPQARAEVLCTRLKLSAVEDSTRLEVGEGRVRLTRSADGASIDVPARHDSMTEGEAPLVAEPVAPTSPRPPVVTGFSLIHADAPRGPVPGYEVLRDGAEIPLGRLAGLRLNLQAHTNPPRVGSLLFAYDGAPHFNTEIQWPYTLIAGQGRRQRSWVPTPGRHTVTATPYTGTYGNGVQGVPATLTIVVTDDR